MEGPERKKLKSALDTNESALPPGWTEHTAPTGHKYFYNKDTKKSTYTRPVAEVPQEPFPYQQPFAPSFQGNHNGYAGQSWQNGYNAYPQNSAYGVPATIQTGGPAPSYGNFQGGYPDQQAQQQQTYQRRPQPQDRPKRKVVIPDCAPWILVYTKLGRRFVHNLETQESYWKFPQNVMKAVIEFDQIELKKKLEKVDNTGSGTGANNVPVKERRRQRSESLQREDEAAIAAELAAAEQSAPRSEEDTVTAPTAIGPPNPACGNADAGSDSEYEEIEVTDDEGEETDGDGDNAEVKDGPVEFDEDDIAYQLAAMGESYGLDPGEYGDGEEDFEEGAQGLALTEQESTALFRDLLDDWHINPYTPWETLVSDGAIVNDERYTILTTSKARKEAWDAWSRDRIATLRQMRETMEKQDPRIPYLALLSEHASPKLYWPEFRRKYKKESAMRDAKLSDKDREKLYREHINRLKLPASTLKRDLLELMGSVPLRTLNRDTSLDALPKELLSDLRFISLGSSIRDTIIRQHIAGLEAAPEDDGGVSAEEQVERAKQRAEREKREAALREREKKVEDEKRKRERDLRMGRERLRDGEREIEQAMRVDKHGLRAQLVGEEQPLVTEQADAGQQ